MFKLYWLLKQKDSFSLGRNQNTIIFKCQLHAIPLQTHNIDFNVGMDCHFSTTTFF